MLKKAIIIIGIIIYILIVIQPNTKALNNEQINKQVYVGYSKVCINPNPEDGPIGLQGYVAAYNRVARFEGDEQEYQQDLYATAVAIMDEDGKIVIFVTCDLCAMSVTIANTIREELENVINVEAENIMIACTHTHSAPAIGFSNSNYPELSNTMRKYENLLKSKITIACSEAINNLKPADTYIKSFDIIREDGTNALNFVRHYTTDATYDDGTPVCAGSNHGNFYWNGGNLLYSNRIGHATEADSTMQVIKFEIEDEEDILMVNWQVHPHITGGATMNTISADFIASFRDTVEKECNCEVAYYSGAGGNINEVTSITDGSEGIEGISYNINQENSKNAYDTSIAYGQKLAQYVINNYNDDFEKVKTEKIKVQAKEVDDVYYRTENDEELLKNARYCQKIWDSSLEDVAKMVEGKFEWGEEYVFPNGYDSTGAKLREAINKSATLKRSFVVTRTDSGEYNCSLTQIASQTSKNRLIEVIGAGFEDRIYSPYHASREVACSTIKEGTKLKFEIIAVTIGEISFVAVPYEMFDTNGKYIKENSPSKMTFILEQTNRCRGIFSK